MAERNTTVNAGPAIEPVPHIGERVAVHGWPFWDGEPGTVVDLPTPAFSRYTVRLDSQPETPFPFWPGELEAIDASV